MVYSSFRFKYQSLIALLNANLLSISTLFCVHPEFLVILIKNLKVMFLILYCSIFKELCAALATAYLLYHIHSSLSSTFLKFFKFLFSVFWTFYQSVTVLPPFLPSVFFSSSPYPRLPSFSLFKRFQAFSSTLCFCALSFECLSIISRKTTFVNVFFKVNLHKTYSSNPVFKGTLHNQP